MINKDDLKPLLLSLGFEKHGNQYSKQFADSEAILKVDFDKNLLIYPEDQGLKINERQTCNFSANENFVVFECVHRLLEKGYKPEHIELEPKWKLGHGASGGRADILIKDNFDKPLLIIECKTPGQEFNKAWKNTELDGDQLFSYAQQIPDTQFLCLYTSSCTEKGELFYVSHIISHKDNPKILEEGKNLKAFKDGGDYKARFAVWRDTYKKEFTTKGIFEINIQPYQIGKDKYTLDDLNPIDAKDKEGKYHKFRTILRKHNVSGRENAFDVLVNLFLCKIVDEAENTADLKFYWKGIAYDSFFDLIDRLQALYKNGMERYLDQDIVYISNDQIENAFWAVRQKRNATKAQIKDYFRQLKFFTNNDFGFIDVHNETLFYKNAKVLLEVVQMWQDLRLKDQEQNQFLGDMFEYFLDQGIKQSEGQFFTPMPICKFILMSLPLEAIIRDCDQAPKAIDYACGAGHFLNELGAQIKPFISQYKQTDAKNFFKEIIGIEKEYRLSKVAKVAAFMYGQEGIEILHHDALDQHPKVQKNSFNILVANPPFAVEGFLETLPEEEREQYLLTQTVSDVANNKNIQCFFIERAKQLLAPGGIAGIIVPSSVLSNSDSTHIGSREILLQYFDIVALVELGSGTFGKTGTNTVVLFIRRKYQLPEPAEHYRNRVEDWFDNDEEMETYQDLHFIKRYCEHIAIPFEHYKTLLHNEPSAELLACESFLDYKKDFDHSTEIKNLIESHRKQCNGLEKAICAEVNKELKTTKTKLSETEVKQKIGALLQERLKELEATQKQEIKKRFLAYLQKIEKDKLLYFVLAYSNPQKVLIVKSPTDNKAQKAFLGYEWSAAKGSEGIKLSTDAYGKHITPLYHPDDRNHLDKLSTCIATNFTGSLTDLSEHLNEYASLVSLADMLDFSRVSFDKRIALTLKRAVEIQSHWDLVKLENLMTIVRGASPRPIDKFLTNDENGINWIKIGDVKESDKYITQTEEKITPEGAEKSRFVKEGDFILSNSMSSGRPYILKISGCIHDGWLLLSEFSEFLDTDYFYYLLSYSKDVKQQLSDNALGGTVKNLNIGRVKNIKIPLPSLKIQQQIVTECEAIDNEVTAAQAAIEKAKRDIEEWMSEVFEKGYEVKKLSALCTMQAGKFVSASDIKDTKTEELYPCYGGNGLRGYTKTFTHEGTYSLIGRQGALCGNVNKASGKFHATEHAVVVTPNLDIDVSWLYYQLKALNLNQYATGLAQPGLSVQKILTVTTPVPPLADQQRLVADVEKQEQIIAAAQTVINQAAAKKQALLAMYI
jgi:type I restriction enzyme M protein